MGRSSSYRPQYYHGAHSAQEEQTEDKTSFFNKAEKQGVALNNNAPFFQTKLNIGGANDQYEKEADAVAGKVVNNNSAGPVVQKKEISSIQRLATSKEEEKPGTNDQRMLRDKEIQEKPEIQRLATPAEDEKLGTNDERMKKDKMIQNKPEIQRMSATAKATAGESASAKATADKSGSTASQSLSSRIESTSGKGNSLPAKTLAEMSRSFGTDFSHVNIHTGSEAVGMNKELSAQAFTHGSDIYFNSGKFDPESSSGKHLLAHELTHVVQQGAGIQKQIQRTCLREAPRPNETPLIENDQLRSFTDENGADLFLRQHRSQHYRCLRDSHGFTIYVSQSTRRRTPAKQDEVFSSEEIQRMRGFLVRNASQRNVHSRLPCINTVRGGISELIYGHHNITGTQCERSLQTTQHNTMEETMQQLHTSGMASARREIRFMGHRQEETVSGGQRRTTTRRLAIEGANASLEPMELESSVWNHIVNTIGSTALGYSVFGISLCDGFHSAMITVDHTNQSNIRMYWSDQTQNHPVRQQDRVRGVRGAQFGWERMGQTGGTGVGHTTPRGLDNYILYAIRSFWLGTSVGGRRSVQNPNATNPLTLSERTRVVADQQAEIARRTRVHDSEPVHQLAHCRPVVRIWRISHP